MKHLVLLASILAVPVAVAGAQSRPAKTPAPTRPATTAPSGGGGGSGGAALYAANCAACHGANRAGGFGPDLRGQYRKRTGAAIAALIAAPPGRMPKLSPTPLDAAQAREVGDFVYASR